MHQIQDLGYSSHRQSFQTTKKERRNIRRAMTKQSKTVARGAAASGGGTTRRRVGSQSARVATRVRPRDTNSSTLRRMSHAYHAHELVSRKSNDKKVVVPWISGNRRNTVVGTHGSGKFCAWFSFNLRSLESPTSTIYILYCHHLYVY